MYVLFFVRANIQNSWLLVCCFFSWSQQYCKHTVNSSILTFYFVNSKLKKNSSPFPIFSFSFRKWPVSDIARICKKIKKKFSWNKQNLKFISMEKSSLFIRLFWSAVHYIICHACGTFRIKIVIATEWGSISKMWQILQLWRKKYLPVWVS